MGQYYYLVSSLPFLSFGSPPPFSYARFAELCRDSQIPDLQNRVLLKERWMGFEQALRNELVRIRCARKKIDPQHHLRGDAYAEPSIARTAHQAARQASPLEAERILDLARWQYLEELSLGHYFDRDFLFIYGLKLKLLERWERVGREGGARLAAEAIGA